MSSTHKRKRSFWTPSSRSPVSVLLSFLCLFANTLLDGSLQTTPRISFGCFSVTALLIGTALERRFLPEHFVEELDAIDLLPGLLSVVGAWLEWSLQNPLGQVTHCLVLVLSIALSLLLSFEYYTDGASFSQLRTRWCGKSRKKLPAKVVKGNTTPTHETGSFNARYGVGKQLGKGFFGTVVLAYDKSPTQEEDRPRQFAAKCINRSPLTPFDERQIRSEVQVLREIVGSSCPYIVRLYDFFDEPEHFYLVLELMRGGELFERIFSKEKYFEKDAKAVIKSIVYALDFLHTSDIVHRDLKPENILLETNSRTSRIKIADFGFARRVGKGCTTACGTPNYVAPEIVNGSFYGKTVDIWALGVVIYILVSGFPPFHHQHRPTLFKFIRNGEYSFPKPYFNMVSFQAQDLIKHCLTVDVHKRITAAEVLQHPWLADVQQERSKVYPFKGGNETCQTVELKKAVSQMKLFNARKRLRASILAAIATNRLGAIVEMLRSERPKNNGASGCIISADS